MPATINGVKSWASLLDDNARLQAERIARLPIVPWHVALMPDAHLGIGAAVGCVVPTLDAIIPAAIGVDIGCGMIAVETTLTTEDLRERSDLELLLQQFGRSIPAGLNHSRNLGSTGLSDRAILDRTRYWLDMNPAPHALSERLQHSAWANLGTLGSGNHFIEVSEDEDHHIWVVVHSGSRNIGNNLANAHIKAAKALAKKTGQSLEDPDLAYFTSGMDEFHAYIADMLWAQRYAFENREVMMDEATNSLFLHVRKGEEVRRINCHHNFAQQEEHFGQTVWITRKGAIQARTTDFGIIPGSMGTSSFIVQGLGNADSYQSSAHGAGRLLSRGAAKRTLTVESLQAAMGDRTWLSGDALALLDEHPDAYKPIEVVMADQRDLVMPLRELRQIVNYKGV